MCAMKDRIPSRILVIDDDIDLLMLLERILRKQHYIVETAASIPEAEEIIPIFEPNLVLLDINIKGEDGRQLCWKLKKSDNPAPAKVLIMSGYDFNTGRALIFGADALLPKPLHIDFLLSQVEFHLAAHFLNKQIY